MFPILLPAFASAVSLLAGLVTHQTAALAALDLAPLPSVTAQLYIAPMAGGYYLVVVSGRASAGSAAVGARVYGEDTWFDDYLFGMGAYSRTDPGGYYVMSQVVYRSVLDEDWGEDEIYAIVDVAGAGSTRTNTIHRSF